MINQETNATLRLKEILNESLQLRINPTDIDKLSDLMNKANNIAIKEDFTVFQNQVRQSIKLLNRLLDNKNKPVKRINLFKETISNFKQDFKFL